MTYFEDVSVGHTRSFGEYEVSRGEIIAFGEQYDPQPFHTDPEAARESIFGGLVASGWHTASITMRMLVEEYFPETRALGATGVDDLRFVEPVRPGDVLSVETEILETEPWDEQRGRVHVGITTLDQSDEAVLTMVGLVLWEREQTA